MWESIISQTEQQLQLLQLQLQQLQQLQLQQLQLQQLQQQSQSASSSCASLAQQQQQQQQQQMWNSNIPDSAPRDFSPPKLTAPIQAHQQIQPIPSTQQHNYLAIPQQNIPLPQTTSMPLHPQTATSSLDPQDQQQYAPIDLSTQQRQLLHPIQQPQATVGGNIVQNQQQYAPIDLSTQQRQLLHPIQQPQATVGGNIVQNQQQNVPIDLSTQQPQWLYFMQQPQPSTSGMNEGDIKKGGDGKNIGDAVPHRRTRLLDVTYIPGVTKKNRRAKLLDVTYIPGVTKKNKDGEQVGDAGTMLRDEMRECRARTFLPVMDKAKKNKEGKQVGDATAQRRARHTKRARIAGYTKQNKEGEEVGDTAAHWRAIRIERARIAGYTKQNKEDEEVGDTAAHWRALETERAFKAGYTKQNKEDEEVGDAKAYRRARRIVSARIAGYTKQNKEGREVGDTAAHHRARVTKRAFKAGYYTKKNKEQVGDVAAHRRARETKRAFKAGITKKNKEGEEVGDAATMLRDEMRKRRARLQPAMDGKEAIRDGIKMIEERKQKDDRLIPENEIKQEQKEEGIETSEYTSIHTYYGTPSTSQTPKTEPAESADEDVLMRPVRLPRDMNNPQGLVFGSSGKPLPAFDSEKRSYINLTTMEYFLTLSEEEKRDLRHDIKNHLSLSETEQANFIKEIIKVKRIDDKDPREALRNQYGAFANKDIKKHTVLGVYHGQYIDTHEDYDAVVAQTGIDNLNSYAWSLPRNKTIAGYSRSNELTTINANTTYSDSERDPLPPNCSGVIVMQNNIYRMIYITNEEIKNGEELLIDYGENYWKSRDVPTEIFDDEDDQPPVKKKRSESFTSR
ncbi:MAG: hypothetical protein ROD09_06235 [Candidatus Sedimenticola sp. (ex Thyasira tokunagai)]